MNPLENRRGDRFAYDAEGQLTEAWYEALNPGGSVWDNQRYDYFIYDEMGNRKGWNCLGNHWTGFGRRDNGLNQYINWSPVSNIYYDDNYPGSSGAGNGVLMAEGWITASYNALNQPVAVWAPGSGGSFWWFGYDPLGRCVKRWISPIVNGAAPPPGTNPAMYFYYDGWNLIQEGPAAATVSRNYVHGARVDEIVESSNGATGQFAYHHYDARGHCILLTGTSGGILEQYDYDAFGLPRFYNASGTYSSASTFGNRFLFTGREWLSDLHLYDYRNRLYQPELGRFLQPDPKEFAAGDYNLYRYCHNDPVNRSDPTGLDWKIDPSMSDKYKERTLDQIARARALHPSVDQKFRNMENNHKVTDVITEAGPKGNRTEMRYDWLGNPKGATLYFSPDNWKADSGYRDPIIGLIHELPHVEHANNGTLEKQLNQVGRAQEAEAIRLENIARGLIDGSRRDENYFHTGPTSITYPLVRNSETYHFVCQLFARRSHGCCHWLLPFDGRAYQNLSVSGLVFFEGTTKRDSSR